MRSLVVAMMLVCCAIPAQAAYVTLDSAGNITAIYGSPQPQDPTVQQIPDTDPRVSAFLNAPAIAAANQTQINAQTSQGITIQCASNASVCTSAITGTYATDALHQSYIVAETVSILQNNAFTNGATTKQWADATGAGHTFTIAQWKEFASAIAELVDGQTTAAATLQAGGTPTWPATTVSLN